MPIFEIDWKNFLRHLKQPTFVDQLVGLCEHWRKLGEKFLELGVDLVADCASGVLELVARRPHGHNVVRVHLSDGHLARHALDERVVPGERYAQRREVAHKAADLVLAHKRGHAIHGRTDQQMKGYVEGGQFALDLLQALEHEVVVPIGGVQVRRHQAKAHVQRQVLLQGQLLSVQLLLLGQQN